MAYNSTTVVQYVEPLASSCFRLTCFVLLTISSVVGNSIVIKTIITMETRKPLTYVLVANLAFAEVIGTIALPAVQVYDEIYTWPFGAFLCHVISPSQVVSCLVVTWTLAIISVYRFFTLFNVRYGLRYGNNRRILLLVVLWTVALGFCTPMFVYSKLLKSPYDDSSWCVVLFEGDTIFHFPSFKKYILVRFVVNFLVPILIMMVFYGAMAVKLKCHMTNQIHPITTAYPSVDLSTSTTTKTTTESGSTALCILPSETSPGNPTRTRRATNNKPSRVTVRELEDNMVLQLDQDLLKMIYVVVSIFIICFLPYQVFHLLEYFEVLTYKNWRYFQIARSYFFLITCIPSALHPLCYGTMSGFYAKAFAYIFLCKIIKNLLK